MMDFVLICKGPKAKAIREYMNATTAGKDMLAGYTTKECSEHPEHRADAWRAHISFCGICGSAVVAKEANDSVVVYDAFPTLLAEKKNLGYFEDEWSKTIVLRLPHEVAFEDSNAGNFLTPALLKKNLKKIDSIQSGKLVAELAPLFKSVKVAIELD